MNNQEEGVVSASEAGGSTASATNLAREVAELAQDIIKNIPHYKGINNAVLNDLLTDAMAEMARRLTEGKVLCDEVTFNMLVSSVMGDCCLGEFREQELCAMLKASSHEPISGGEG